MKNLPPKERVSLLKLSKERGEWAELQFLSRATSRGFTVSKPWGDTAKYDFVVERSGALHRVQVKSTYRRVRGSKAYLCNIVHGGARTQRAYTTEEADFFALFVIPEDAWYILPLDQVRRARWALFLNPRDRRNLYFPYLEAWHLLRESR